MLEIVEGNFDLTYPTVVLGPYWPYTETEPFFGDAIIYNNNGYFDISVTSSTGTI